MKMKAFILAMASGFCLFAMTMTAMASDVYISLVPDNALYDMEPGDIIMQAQPTIQDGSCWISDYTTSVSSYEPGKSYSYTIELRCDSGDEFTSDTEVSVYGAYEVSITSRSARRMTVRAKTYPIYMMDKVQASIDWDEKVVTWDKIPYAKGYSVKVYYEDKNGNERTVKKSVTSPRLSLSGYIPKYDNVRVSVKATRGTGTGDRFIAETNYVYADGGGDDDNESTDQYDFRIPTATRYGVDYDDSSTWSSGSSSGGPGQINAPGSGGSSGPGGPGMTGSSGGQSAGFTGWQGGGNEWYYLIGGVRATGWVEPTRDEWYFLDSSGRMLSGWQLIGNLYYYLNPNHDGTYGRMLVGYQNIGNRLYYLNEQHDGTFGAMWASRYTPNGRYAGPDGTVY